METLINNHSAFVKTNNLATSKASATIIKSLCVLVALFPILDLYTTPFFVSFGELALFAFMLISFAATFFARKKKGFNKRYLLFLCYGVLISLVIIIIRPSSTGNIVKRLIRDIVFAIYFLYIGRFFFDLRFFKKVYLNLVYFVFFLLAIQYLFHFVLGYNLFFYVPFLKLNYAESDATALISSRIAMESFRPSSIFFEPAHLVEYCFLALPLSLFSKNKKILRSLLITLFLILSTSTTGIVLSGVSWILWFLSRFKRNVFIGLVVVAFGATVFILLLNNFGYVDKILQIFDTSSYSSGSLRVARGFLIFNQLDIRSKLFGIGFGGFDSYFYAYGLQKILSTQYTDYMSGISYILVSSGLIGLFLYVFAMFKGFFNSGSMHRSIVILIIIIMFTSQIYISSNYLLYMMILFGTIKKNEIG